MFEKIKEKIKEKQRNRYVELEELEMQIYYTGELIKRSREEALESYQNFIDEQVKHQDEINKILDPFGEWLKEVQKVYFGEEH